MPVATCSLSVAARIGSTNARSPAGEPPGHTAPYPSFSISAACSGVGAPNVHTPTRPRSSLLMRDPSSYRRPSGPASSVSAGTSFSGDVST
ncbi:Uncharacterised protein [Mycobacteroides abscessus subsp. abscessus]|nr:Uncharacterised protein [Mycobacteroides abscessus subsp. abscessus]